MPKFSYIVKDQAVIITSGSRKYESVVMEITNGLVHARGQVGLLALLPTVLSAIRGSEELCSQGNEAYTVHMLTAALERQGVEEEPLEIRDSRGVTVRKGDVVALCYKGDVAWKKVLEVYNDSIDVEGVDFLVNCFVKLATKEENND